MRNAEVLKGTWEFIFRLLPDTLFLASRRPIEIGLIQRNYDQI